VRGALGQRVGDELDRRRQADADALADRGADAALVGLEDVGRGLAVLVAAEDGVEDGRLLEVARDAGVGDGDEPESFVLVQVLELLGDDDLDQVGDLEGEGGVIHDYLCFRVTCGRSGRAGPTWCPP
jgi:hypothetical protein